MEDETYSLIFASLKHPIRRRILRMLGEKPLTYSEILEILSIDSGHFSYHLENLGDLTSKDKNGYYHLSSFGRAAVKLMGGVEEHVPVSPQRRNRPKRLFAKTYPIALALVLLCASAFFVSYVFAVPDASETTRLTFSCNPASTAASKTSDFDFLLTELSSENGTHSIDLTIGFEGTASQSPSENTFTSWYEDTMWLEVNQNLNYSMEGVLGATQVFNETSPELTELPSGVVATFYDPKIDAIFFKTDFSQIAADVYTPSGKAITDCFQYSDSYTVNYVSILEPGWLMDSSNMPSFRSCDIPIDEVGAYEVKITNRGSAPWSGKFSVNLSSQRMERPYFYWGITGIVAALGYLIFAATLSIRRGESEQRPE